MDVVEVEQDVSHVRATPNREPQAAEFGLQTSAFRQESEI
jgi:hypothetical protein